MKHTYPCSIYVKNEFTHIHPPPCPYLSVLMSAYITHVRRKACSMCMYAAALSSCMHVAARVYKPMFHVRICSILLLYDDLILMRGFISSCTNVCTHRMWVCTALILRKKLLRYVHILLLCPVCVLLIPHVRVTCMRAL
jgi:hypothetical protein